MTDYKRLTIRHPHSDYIGITETKQLPDNEQTRKVLDRLAELEDKIGNGEITKVKHGKWIANEHTSRSEARGRMTHYATYKCSVCGKWNGRKKQRYCPNCGAKMDLEELDND